MLSTHHCLASPGQGRMPSALRGLSAKKLGARPVVAHESLRGDVDHAYELLWQVGEPAAQLVVKRAVPQAVLPPHMSSAAACAAGVELLQQQHADGELAVHGEGGAPDGLAGGAGGSTQALQTFALWGVMKSVALEQPALSLQLTAEQLQSIGALHVAARFGDRAGGHDEFGATLLGGAMTVPRLVLSGMRQEAPTGFYLDCQPKGSLSNMVPVPVSLPQQQQEGRSCISPAAVGLNFRDVLNVLVRYSILKSDLSQDTKF